MSASSVVFIPTLKESRLFPLIAGKIKIKSLEISGNREGAERERELMKLEKTRLFPVVCVS